MSGPSASVSIRSLWINGLTSKVSANALQVRLSNLRDQLTRACSDLRDQADFGTFTVRIMAGSSGAWVDFTVPSLAQEVVSLLNGSTIGSTSVLVRYSRLGELTTSAPGACRNLWLSSASKAVSSTPPATASALSAASGATGGTDVAASGGAMASSSSPAAANSGRHQGSSTAPHAPPPPTTTTMRLPPPPPAERSDAKRKRDDEAADEAKRQRDEPALLTDAVKEEAAARGEGRERERERERGASRGGGGGSLGSPGAFDEAVAGEAEAVRSALDKAAVSTALAEIRHFLRSDPRLPAKTRHAAQFLDGLRGEMVRAHKEESHPQYFDCPFVAADVRQYTFKEVRQQFGAQFKDKFWPIFQAFNSLLPALAPEPEREEEGVTAMMPG